MLLETCAMKLACQHSRLGIGSMARILKCADQTELAFTSSSHHGKVQCQQQHQKHQESHCAAKVTLGAGKVDPHHTNYKPVTLLEQWCREPWKDNTLPHTPTHAGLQSKGVALNLCNWGTYHGRMEESSCFGRTCQLTSTLKGSR